MTATPLQPPRPARDLAVPFGAPAGRGRDADFAPPLDGDALVQLGDRAEREGRTAQAREHYELALTRLRPGAPRRASDLLRWIARTHKIEGAMDAALDCLAAARAVADAADDDSARGHASNLEAIVHWEVGELDAAERLYLEASGFAALAGDEALAAMASQNLGVIANARGDTDSARHHYTASLQSYRRLGLTRDVCVALNNLGMLAMQRGALSVAERDFLEAMEISVLTGDLPTQIGLEINLAELLILRREFARATTAVEHATALIARTGDSASLAHARKVAGIIARETGALDEAEAHLLEATTLAVARHDLLLEAEIARELAELERLHGRNRQVLGYLNRAHQLFAQLRARQALADIDSRNASLEQAFTDVARQWGESIEAKDRYTQGHCRRVADLACEIAALAGLDPQALFWFRIGALLHDVGKLMVPAEVLNKAGALTPAEWTLMRSHPAAGVTILASIEFPWDVRPIIESHHERWDGRGYPAGLAGDAIPLVARILCLADVYDALTSERSYKRALPHDEAMAQMRLDVGAQFDPALFVLLEEAMAAREEGRELAG